MRAVRQQPAFEIGELVLAPPLAGASARSTSDMVVQWPRICQIVRQIAYLAKRSSANKFRSAFAGFRAKLASEADRPRQSRRTCSTWERDLTRA